MFKKREDLYINGKKVGYTERDMTPDEIEGAFKGIEWIMGNETIMTCSMILGALVIVGLIIAWIANQIENFPLWLLPYRLISVALLALGFGLGFFLSTRRAKKEVGIGKIIASSVTFSLVYWIVSFLIAGLTNYHLLVAVRYMVASFAFVMFHPPLSRTTSLSTIFIASISLILTEIEFLVARNYLSNIDFLLQYYRNIGVPSLIILVGLCTGYYYRWADFEK